MALISPLLITSQAVLELRCTFFTEDASVGVKTAPPDARSFDPNKEQRWDTSDVGGILDLSLSSSLLPFSFSFSPTYTKVRNMDGVPFKT